MNKPVLRVYREQVCEKWSMLLFRINNVRNFIYRLICLEFIEAFLSICRGIWVWYINVVTFLITIHNKFLIQKSTIGLYRIRDEIGSLHNLKSCQV
jgi:hypothetical protein